MDLNTLKAQAFDLLRHIQNLQSNLNNISQLIAQEEAKPKDVEQEKSA